MAFPFWMKNQKQNEERNANASMEAEQEQRIIQETTSPAYDNYSTPVSPIMSACQDENFLKWCLTSSDDLEVLEHSLRGEVYDYALKDFMPKRKPYLNEDGINAIMTIYQAKIVKNTILSFYRDKEHSIVALEVCMDVNKLLFYKWADFGMLSYPILKKNERLAYLSHGMWGIVDKNSNVIIYKLRENQLTPDLANWDIILDLVDHAVESSLKRARDGFEAKNIRTMNKISETTITKPPQQQTKRRMPFGLFGGE